MTDDQKDVRPRPVDRRTLRLTFRSTAGEVRLVSKERLDMIGGSLAIESNRGEGTVITAKIPLRAGRPAKRRAPKTKRQ